MADKKTFESKTAQLAEIVNTLQSGEASLNEAMELFEKGVKVNLILEETGEIVPFETDEQ